jgi:hypothetical protein
MVTLGVVRAAFFAGVLLGPSGVPGIPSDLALDGIVSIA